MNLAYFFKLIQIVKIFGDCKGHVLFRSEVCVPKKSSGDEAMSQSVSKLVSQLCVSESMSHSVSELVSQFAHPSVIQSFS